MKSKQIFSELTPPRQRGMLARFFALFFCLVLGMNVWGALPATTAPATKSFAEKTFLDVAGTQANAQIKDGDNTVVYNTMYLLKTLNPAFITGTTATDKSDSKSNVSNLADNGFLAEGSSSTANNNNAGGYSYIKITSEKSLIMYVTGANSVAMLASGNSTSSNKWIGLGVDEVKADGTLTEVSAPVDNKNYTSNKVITVGPSLTPSKYYKITITSGNTSNCSLWQIRFGQPAADPYTVTFNANGGDCGTSSLTEASAGAGVTLPSATPADEATQEFKGWAVSSTETDPAKIFAAGAKYEPAADVTLYAIYGAKTVKSAIVYANTKGATNSNPTQYTEGVGIAEFAALEDVTGFHFTGWNPSSISSSATGEQTITAEWEEKPVDIFSMVVASGATSKSVDAGTTIALTASEATITGGSVNFKNNNTSAKNVGSTQSSKAAFMLEKTGSYFEIVLPAAGDGLRVGDVISATVLGGKDERGIFFTTSSTSTTLTEYYVKTNTGDASNSYKSGLTYTIKAGDDLIGAKNIYVERYTGNGTYFTELKIARPASSVPNTTWNVSFDMQGATSTAIEAQSVVNGKKAVKPEDPEKTGFNFVKWVVASTEADYDFNAAVTADVALKAVWVEGDPCDAFEVTCTNGQLEPFEEWLEYTRDQNATVDIWAFNLVAVTGGTVATYEWYRNTEKSHEGANLVRWNQDTDPGYTSQYSKLPAVDVAGTFYYFCKVTSTTGCVAYSKYITYVVNSTVSSEKKLTRAVFSNGFDAFINETAHTVTAYYLDGQTAPTLSVGNMTVSAAATAAIDGTTITVTAEDGTTQDYAITLEAVTPAAVGEYVFDAVPSWVKAPYGYDASKGIKYAKNADDDRIQLGNTRQYYFVEACEKLVLHTASGITSDRNINVYVNNVKVDAITKAPKYNAAGSYIEIPCNGSAAMVAIVSNQTGGDGGFGKAEIVAHVTSTDATLSALSVADNTIAPAFAAATYNYTCKLPYGTEAVPAVSYTLNDANASAIKTDAASVTGTTTIVVTAEDGTTQLTYTIQFSVAAAATDATLSALSYGDPATAISPVAEQYTYDVNLPYGTAAVPALTAVVNEEHANAVVTDAADFDAEGHATSTVVVTAQDGTTEKTYTVNFAKALYPSVVIFDGSTMSNMVASPDATTGLSWAVVGSTMNAGDKNATYQGTSYTRSLSGTNSSATKHFTITIPENKQGRIHFLVMTNSSSSTRSAWITDSADKGVIGDAIASATSSSYTDLGDATTDWLDEGTYYLHTDNTVNFFVISVEMKSVDPKCEAPVITTQPETNKQFGAGAMTATVVASVEDGGALSYQWYNEADEAVVGATAATLSTETEGKYYVVITNTLADHRDNSTKSELAELAHRVLNDATLSALTYGGNAIALVADQYEYNVQLAKGTVDVPALDATTNSVYASKVITDAAAFVSYAATSTVVVTAEDGVATQTYTVNFTVKHDVDLQDVTGDMTWDFTNKAAADGDKTVAEADKGNYVVLANTDIKGTFANAEYMAANYNKYTAKAIQATGLKIHTTVPGFITVTFAQTGGDKVRELYINGVATGKIPSGTANETYTQFVEAGDVVLTSWEASTSKWQMFNYATISFKAAVTTIVRPSLEAGKIGTVCLPYAVLAGNYEGATFYSITHKELKDGQLYKIFFEEVDNLVAGQPYIFEADGGNITAIHGDATAADSVPFHGLYGTFTGISKLESDGENIYIISNNKVRLVAETSAQTGEGVSLGANRAYINMADVPVDAPALAPGRKRISLGTNETNVATDLEAISGSDNIEKLMIDGVIYIRRGEKLYDVTGRLVK